MKMKLMIAAGALLAAAAVSAFVYVNKESDPIDDLFNANVEALALYETDRGTCCSDPNSSCVLSWVTVPGHYLRAEIGPCD